MKQVKRTEAREVNEARSHVVGELLRWARMLRKNGSPEEAMVAAEYEQLLEADFERRQQKAA